MDLRFLVKLKKNEALCIACQHHTRCNGNDVCIFPNVVLDYPNIDLHNYSPLRKSARGLPDTGISPDWCPRREEIKLLQELTKAESDD